MKEHMEQECKFTKKVPCIGCSGFTSAADYRSHFDSCIPGDVWSSCNDGQLITRKFPKFNRDNQQSKYIPVKLHGSDEIFFLRFKKITTEDAYYVYVIRTMQADKDLHYTIMCSISSGTQSRSFTGPAILQVRPEFIDPVNSMIVPSIIFEGDGRLEMTLKIEKQN